MVARLRPSLPGALLVALLVLAPTSTRAQTDAPREIPGITVDDQFPQGCVDCHLNYPDEGVDARFSTLMAGWTQEVDPALLAISQAASEAGVTLEGVHPEVRPEVFQRIPQSCIGCHSRRSDRSPDISRLTHLTHLTGGAENIFLTTFQGQCTHCHKLDTESGIWAVASGAEGG